MSQATLTVASSIEGPYTRVGVAVPTEAHNVYYTCFHAITIGFSASCIASFFMLVPSELNFLETDQLAALQVFAV